MASNKCAKCGETKPSAHAVCDLAPAEGFNYPCELKFDAGIPDSPTGATEPVRPSRPKSRDPREKKRDRTTTRS